MFQIVFSLGCSSLGFTTPKPSHRNLRQLFYGCSLWCLEPDYQAFLCYFCIRRCVSAVDVGPVIFTFTKPASGIAMVSCMACHLHDITRHVLHQHSASEFGHSLQSTSNFTSDSVEVDFELALSGRGEFVSSSLSHAIQPPPI